MLKTYLKSHLTGLKKKNRAWNHWNVTKKSWTYSCSKKKPWYANIISTHAKHTSGSRRVVSKCGLDYTPAWLTCSSEHMCCWCALVCVSVAEDPSGPQPQVSWREECFLCCSDCVGVSRWNVITSHLCILCIRSEIDHNKGKLSKWPGFNHFGFSSWLHVKFWA